MFTYPDGNLNGNDGWAAGTTGTRAVQIVSNHASPQSVTTGNSVNASSLPGINWLSPWRITIDVQTQTAPPSSSESGIEWGLDDAFDISFLRGTAATPAGTLRIDIEDGTGPIPTGAPTVADNSSHTFVLTYAAGFATGTLDGVDLFGGAVAFSPQGSQPNARLFFLNPSTVPTTLIDRVKVEYNT